MRVSDVSEIGYISRNNFGARVPFFNNLKSFTIKIQQFVDKYFDTHKYVYIYMKK